ncbi:MAG TPA: hypothetical protein VNI20_10810, partial [Fimbriimonadaceae bacterium]|nr:hypothetical protein [Fimbriimonadaceae bacterium]
MNTLDLTGPMPSRAIKAAGLIFLAVSAAIASAETAKDLTDKVGHAYLSNVSEATIDDTVAKGYRMFDIEVVSTGPHRYTCSFVKNSGPYAESWWWKANQSEAQMTQFLTDHSARITDLETYFVDGQRRYAFVAVPNRDTQAKAWWWFAGKSWDEMNDFVQSKNGRLIDIEVETTNGKHLYSGVLIRNTGADQKNWIRFGNTSKKQIQELMQFGGRGDRMRLVDLERVSNGRYAGILEETGGQAWWWLTDLPWEDVSRLQGQLASRIIDIERNVVGNKTTFDLILIDNSNSLESRMRTMLLSNSDGTKGFMLKEVNGPTLGAILPDFRTYPASSIKVLEHYYWSSRVYGGVDPLAAVPIYTNWKSDTHNANQIDYYLS